MVNLEKFDDLLGFCESGLSEVWLDWLFAKVLNRGGEDVLFAHTEVTFFLERFPINSRQHAIHKELCDLASTNLRLSKIMFMFEKEKDLYPSFDNYLWQTADNNYYSEDIVFLIKKILSVEVENGLVPSDTTS